MSQPLTHEQASMLRYFWNEKGDPTRYCEWESLLPALEEHHPHVLKAWKDHKASIRILDVVMNDLSNSVDD
jgi:hypothetical protein